MIPGAELGLLVVAWLATLSASLLPDIVARSFARRPGVVDVGAGRMALLLALSGITAARDGLRPVSGYVIALAASAIGDLVVSAMQRTARWRSWEATATETKQLAAQPLLHLIPAACMGATIVGRLDPQQLFLQSPAIASVQLPFLPPVSWWVMAPILALVLLGPLLPSALVAMRASSARPIVGALTGGAAFGAINAAQEEFRFRAVLLANALPSLGAGQGLAMTAVFFGLGHYFGRPSGYAGVLLSAIAGLVLGETMLGTNSFLLPWLMHGLLDVLIFSTVALRPAERS